MLALKDPNRPFPTGAPLGVLKWRLQVCTRPVVQMGRLGLYASAKALPHWHTGTPLGVLKWRLQVRVQQQLAQE